jgi:predicted DNA binding protein
MQHLRLRLAFPRETRHPMQNFLVDSPSMHREELWSWSFVGDVPACLFRAEGDIDAYRERIADVQSVHEFDLTPVTDTSFYSFVRAVPSDAEREWMESFARGSIVVVPPIVYTGDGDAMFTVLGDSDDLRAMVTGLPDRVDATIDRVGEYDHHLSPDAALTNRQRDVVATAVDLGYYEVPREATLADVADALDVAASTVSDHLRKAESAVMKTTHKYVLAKPTR